MKASAKENLTILALAWASVLAVFGLFALLDWASLDWRKWGPFAVFTLIIFGYLLNKYGRDIRRPRLLLTFVGTFVVHVGMFAVVFRSVPRFFTFLYVFTTPLEVAIGGFILVVIGGARTANKGSHPHP